MRKAGFVTVLILVGLLVVFGFKFLFPNLFYLFPVEGITMVETNFQGKPVPSRVRVNDSELGATPIKHVLGVGDYSIKIKPPKGFRPPAWYRAYGAVLFRSAVGEGVNLTIELEKDYYLTFPEPGLFSIQEDGRPGVDKVKGCANNEFTQEPCGIYLPRAGTYNVRMMRLGCDRICDTSFQTVTITDAEPQKEVRWSH